MFFILPPHQADAKRSSNLPGFGKEIAASLAALAANTSRCDVLVFGVAKRGVGGCPPPLLCKNRY
jgi:hypothetical protein